MLNDRFQILLEVAVGPQHRRSFGALGKLHALRSASRLGKSLAGANQSLPLVDGVVSGRVSQERIRASRS